MSPIAVGALVTVIVLAGAAFGAWARTRLPAHHLDEDTRDMVKVGVGFLSTLAALVLGLIVASAKTAFDARADEVHAAAAKIALAGEELRSLGPEGDSLRARLRQAVADRADALWGPGGPRASTPGQWEVSVARIRVGLHAIVPADDAQREAKVKALQAFDELERLRSVAVVSEGSSVTMPLLVLLVAWMVVIAAAINVFAPRHGTVAAFNVLCALSSASAIVMVLEMDQPFGGFIRVSDAPIRAAVAALMP